MTVAVATTRAELAEYLAHERRSGHRVGLVPTMGALHAGHASLMAHAAEAVGPGPVVVSIFVNPLQFGPDEDLDRYPRTLDTDLTMCEAAGVRVVFAPSADEVYPTSRPDPSDSSGSAVTIDPGSLGTILEGATRPGHFVGVLTVVAKLFGLVRPDTAVFGEKDYQQLTLIRRLASDLCLGVEVIGAATIREPDGLAMSSRNRFLEGPAREQATVLSRALQAAQGAALSGATAAREAALAELASEPEVALDYFTLRSADLGDPKPDAPGRALVAAQVGGTRLIDNVALTIGPTANLPQ